MDHRSRRSNFDALLADSSNQGNFLTGLGETAFTMGSSMLAEPVAGIVGLGSLVMGDDPSEAASTVEATRQAMTYEPRTEVDHECMGNTGEAMRPLGEIIAELEKESGVINTSG